MNIDLEILCELPPPIVSGGIKVTLAADENETSHRGIDINRSETLSLATS
jgi:hypothetical protein